ncbi:MAG: DUF2807 domain-containing protein [Chitinophagia bacterium]|nr:DUF2807 domain-containing protein [Chitinophagia bacterium]
MQKVIVWLLTFIGSITLNAQETVHVVKDARAQERRVGEFTAIQVFGAMDVFITQGKQAALAVSASSDEEREAIITEVRDNTLYISIKNKMVIGWKNQQARAYVTFSNLEMMDISGASDINIIGVLKSNDLVMKISGASDVKGELDLNNFRINLNGASDCKLTGKASRMKVQVSGASDFKGYDLKSAIAEVSASGASEVHLSVEQEISVEASGASSVYYKGTPKIRNASVAGASSFSKKQ